MNNVCCFSEISNHFSSVSPRHKRMENVVDENPLNCCRPPLGCLVIQSSSFCGSSSSTGCSLDTASVCVESASLGSFWKITVHIPSRSSYPSAHSLHISGPSPSHPSHDLSHSKQLNDPSLFTQNCCLVQVLAVMHSSISVHPPRWLSMIQPLRQTRQAFGPAPVQPPVAQAL